MKKNILIIGICMFVCSAFSQVHTTYLWHMQQPIYWPEKSKQAPFRYQSVKESNDLKASGDSWNMYSDGKSHPLNNLQEIFGKDDRVNAYQHGPKNSVNTIKSHPEAGAQVNYSGCLIENVNSLANANQWGYYPNWANNFTEAKNWKTSGGNPRMDMIGFTFHHALSPLISERALSKEIQAHKYISTQTFGGEYSKGYWPAECSFSERIIKVLVQEGIEWSIVANSHLARTLNDYQDNNYGTSGVNSVPPNAADKVATNGVNWWSGQLDGRGGSFAAPYCYQAHKAKYVDPETGFEYIIDVVPMADLLSYQDGYQTMSTGDIDAHIAPYNDASQPSLVLLAHDGDNAFAGGFSYYNESVPNFVGQAAQKGYTPTTIQQFLNDHPVPAGDFVKVEDGSWVNAASDWGHPQFINWLWPLYDSENYRFDPNGWTEDARNWAVIVAAENYVFTAEDLAGGTDLAEIVSPSSNSSNAEKAWHFFMPALTSGYMYYGKAIDMEVKQTIACNNALEFARDEIAKKPNSDFTPPSVFIPQRFPYNPGGKGFGPIYGYKEFQNSSDFHVWTFAHDVSGVQSMILKYRIDDDGVNPLNDNVNDLYTGGPGVGGWVEIEMTGKSFPKGNVTNDPEIDFFELPEKIADLYYAEIRGLSNVLVDYYVESTDNKGNTFKTPIQHVYVGEYNANSSVSLDVSPVSGRYDHSITIEMTASSSVAGTQTNIYYTTDGSTPDKNGKKYTQAFELPYQEGAVVVVKAVAINSNGNKSDVIERKYRFDEDQPYTIHFKNTENWDDVYIYLYDKVNNTPLPGWDWPGSPMEQEQGAVWYAHTINEAVEVGIVVSDGATQKTEDLFRNVDGWYDYSTKKWTDICPGDCPGELPLPELSVNPLGGTFLNLVSVHLTATHSGQIFYTLDGTKPNSKSLKYTRELEFNKTTLLRAVAINETGKSAEIEEEYVVEKSEAFTLHFFNSENWDEVYIYLFNKTTNSPLPGWEWPGRQMVQEQGSRWYSCLIEESAEIGIVFNNNNQGKKSKDEFRNKEGWYNFSDESWYDHCPKECPGVIPEGLTIHYNNNTTNWGNVRIYFWNTSPQNLTTKWPGEPMSDPDGDGWYSYFLEGVECTDVIFSNNGASKTADLETCGVNSYYDRGWVGAPGDLKLGKNPLLTEFVEVYPNPLLGNVLTVSCALKSKIKIVGFSGQIVKEEYLTKGENQINCEDLGQGVYFIQIKSNEIDNVVYKIVKL